MLNRGVSCRYNSSYWMFKRIIHQGAGAYKDNNKMPRRVHPYIFLKHPTVLLKTKCTGAREQNTSPKCSFGMKIILMKTIRAPKDLASNFDLSHKCLKRI